jgi:peptidoglycan/LPS O-acetylase OafA/YrhL
VDVLFVPLVIALAVGAGTLPALLSIRPLVYAGQISFSLYMVHELVHTAWNWAAQQFELTLAGTAGPWIVAGLLTASVLAAMLLYHGVEEPARRWMRRMVDVREAPPSSRVDDDAEPADAMPTTIEGARAAKTISARAG